MKRIEKREKERQEKEKKIMCVNVYKDYSDTERYVI